MNFEVLRREAFVALSQQYPTEDVTASRAKDVDEFIAAAVWVVELPGWNGEDALRLLVAIPGGFPLVMPYVFIDRAHVRSLGYPLHVGANGYVCTLDPETSRTNVMAPGAIVLEVVRKSRSILDEARLASAEARCYDDEYIAYWKQTYVSEPTVNDEYLSLLGPDTRSDDEILCGTFSSTYGGYKHVLFVKGPESDEFLATLKRNGVWVTLAPVYNAGELLSTRPPFSMTFPESMRLVEESSPEHSRSFRRYINRSRQPIIVFQKKLGSRIHHLGWTYNIPREWRGSQRKTGLYEILANRPRTYTTRIAPADMTPERLQRRTTGGGTPGVDSCLTAMVVGLGSVGSHVASILGSIQGVELEFVDADNMTVENIGRHLLGLKYCGHNKAHAVAEYLRDSGAVAMIRKAHPLSIVGHVEKKPDILTNFDFLFVCVGNENVEEWIDEIRKQGHGPRRGVFYLWVEPYLFGGHCLFVPTSASLGFKECFEPEHYCANVLSPEAYDEHQFVDRELGCQTSFMPYSGSNVKLFVGAIMSHAVMMMRSPPSSAVAVRWIGDIEDAKRRGYQLSAVVADARFGEVHSIIVGST